jgi:UDP-4-amino-4,6-dideoxy-N-acetyl-beta-L-altrosamine transaminase
MPIPYGRQSIDEQDVVAVEEVLHGDWLTQGPQVEAFERAVAEYVGAPHAVAFSSGTAALHGAAFAAGLGPGDEVLTSAMTFAASANCAAYVGATPRFADIEGSTWNVSADTVAAATGERTRAVIPVHFTGLPAPVAEIRAAVGDEVVVIEDAAQALGARSAGEPVGSCTHSDMVVFSFHPVKTVTSAEGGVVTTRDADLRDRMLTFRTHGMVRDPDRLRERDQGGWYHEQQELGFNYRLSDVHSALGRSQMSKVDRFVDARNAIAARYREWLGGIEALELPPEPPPGSVHARHLFVIRHRDGSEARRQLYDRLRERDIFCQVHYLPVHLHPYYRDNYGCRPGDFPEAEAYYAGCLSLPCFPDLGEPDQRRVVDAIRELVR